MPVVDNDRRMVGIITFDDVLDVILEENEEDFSKMAAIQPTVDAYFKTSVFTHAKNRNRHAAYINVFRNYNWLAFDAL